MDETSIRKRLQALLALPPPPPNNAYAYTAELQAGATTLIAAVHGAASPQLKALHQAIENAQGSVRHFPSAIQFSIAEALKGALKNLQSEIDAGAIGSISRGVSGEVLGDIVGLAKAALAENNPNSKNVAAVLAAAAFEDTIRRMGAAFAGVDDRRDLQDVVTELKKAGILEGPQLSLTLSHLKFRNDALHADWDKIDKVGVSTALQLVQELLLKHFQK